MRYVSFICGISGEASLKIDADTYRRQMVEDESSFDDPFSPWQLCLHGDVIGVGSSGSCPNMAVGKFCTEISDAPMFLRNRKLLRADTDFEQLWSG